MIESITRRERARSCGVGWRPTCSRNLGESLEHIYTRRRQPRTGAFQKEEEKKWIGWEGMAGRDRRESSVAKDEKSVAIKETG